MRMAFGSCRVSLPHHGPYTLPKEEHSDGREFDALYTLVEEMLRAEHADWPQVLLLLGDQVYADEVSPQTLAFIRKRRDVREPPGEEVADFEEYTRLYREAWEDPHIRYLFSTVSTSMVIDDHDVHDDWNISAAWVEDMNKLDWWPEREIAGLVSYWIYQFARQPLAAASPRVRPASPRPRGRRRMGGPASVRRQRAGRARWRALELLPRPRLVAAHRDRLADRTGPRRGQTLDAEPGGMGVVGGTPVRRLRPPADRHLGPADPSAGPAPCRALGRGGVPRRVGRRGRAPARSCAAPPTSTTGRPSASRSTGSRAARAGGGRGIRRATGDDHGPLRRCPPRVSRRDRLHTLRRRAQRVWQAVCSPFRNALDSRERRTIGLGDSRSRTALRRPGAPGRGAPRRGALAPGGGAVLRQPGRDDGHSPAARRA